MSKFRIPGGLASALPLLMFSGALAQAQTTWTGANDSLWTDAGNWNAGVPDAATDAVIPAAVPNFPAVPAASTVNCRNLTLNSTASLDLGLAASLEIFGNASFAGAVSGSGTLRLEGADAAQLTSSFPLPSVAISKDSGIPLTVSSLVEVSGALLCESGDLIVNSTLRLSGASTFAGGSLSGSGVLDLEGPVAFSGTQAPTPPSIQCAADWNSDGSFLPQSGTVVFNGTNASPSTITGTPQFASVELAIGAGVVTSVPIQVNGSLNQRGNSTLNTTASLDINGLFDLDVGSQFLGGGASHTVGGNLIVDGQILGNPEIVLDGASNTTFSGSLSIPRLTVSKTGIAQASGTGVVEVTGSFNLLSGILNCAAPLRVAGTSQCLGGSLGSGGTLDANGDLTFSNCAVIAAPAISCAGDWSSDSNFNPTSGTVTFDGAITPQDLDGSPNFSSLVIAESARVTQRAVTRIRGSLTVSGEYRTEQVFDLDGNATVNTNAFFFAGNLDHRFGRNLTVNGTVSEVGGTFTFDGSLNATVSISSASILGDMSIQKTGGASLSTSGSFTVNGKLDLLFGTMSVSTNSAPRVVGNANFLGGALTGAGTLIVEGSVLFDGTVAVTPPAIQVEGNWTANSQFQPSSGTVTFTGAGAQTLSGTAALFNTLTIDGGSSVSTVINASTRGTLTVNGGLTTSASLQVGSTLSIGSLGTIELGSQAHVLEAGLSCSGTLQFDPGCQLLFQGDTSGSVGSSSTLPPASIAKTGSASISITNTVIGGDLTLSSGRLNTANSSFTVEGNASFLGGEVFDTSGSGIGTIRVEGDVLFAGGQSRTLAPNFVCGDDWTSDSNFQPTQGTVTFEPLDGVSEISGSDVRLNAVTVSQGELLQTAVDVFIASTFTVNGQFSNQGTSANLNCDGDVTVGDDTQFSLGSGTYSFAENLTTGPQSSLSSQVGAQIVFDGFVSGSLSLSSSFGFLRDTRVAKAGFATLTVTGPVKVDGDLEMESGILSIGGETTVLGNAVFTGGQLIGSSDLLVQGDASFTETLVLAGPDIFVSGDWSADASFQPTSGRVIFDGGPNLQRIQGSTANFFTLEVDISADVLSENLPLNIEGNLVVFNGTLSVQSSGVTEVGGTVTSNGTLDLSGPISVDGVVTINAGSFTIGGGQFADDLVVNGGFNSSGILSMVGSQAATLISVGDLPSLVIDKQGSSTVTTSGELNVNGDLTVSSGTFTVNSTVNVANGGQFDGGTLTGFGLLDIEGDTVFGGTVAVTPPNMNCGGNFTLHPNFLPTTRTVDFDALTDPSNPQLILGSGGRFFALNVTIFGAVRVDRDLQVAGALTIGGTLQVSESLDVDGALTVNNSGALLAGSEDHSFGSSFTLNGDLDAAGVFTLDGFGSSTLSVPGVDVLTSIKVQKAGNLTLSGDTTILGSFVLEQGALSISSGTTQVIGSAEFKQGSLGGDGTLDIDGNATFSGATAVTPPTIRISGDWTADANFNPSSSRSVIFDGVSATPGSEQVVSGSPLLFGAVSVAVGSGVQLSEPVEVDGTLIVDGVFRTTAPIAVRGTVSVNTVGTLDLGAATHLLSSSFDCAGELLATGTFVCDGSSQSFASVQALPSIQKVGAGTFFNSGDLTVGGNFSHDGGVLSVSSSSTINIAGNANLSGGLVSGSSNSTLEVDGNLTLVGAAALTPPTIRCGGNWSSDSNFTPPSGLVIMDGSGSIVSSEFGSPSSFNNLQVLDGTRVVQGLMEVRGTALDVETLGTLIVGGSGQLTIEDAKVDVAGTLQVDAGGVLRLGDPCDVDILEIGSLILSGTANLPATIGGFDGGGFAFTVDGQLDAQQFVFTEPDESGLVLSQPVAILRFQEGTFDLPRNTPNAVLLDVNVLSENSPGIEDTFRNLIFQNSGGAANVFNVRSLLGDAVTLEAATGAFSGDAFEDDPGDRISWTSGSQTELTNFVAIPGAAEATVEWGTSAEGTTASYRLERSSGGLFGSPVLVPATGAPGFYSVEVSGLVPGTQYTWRLTEVLADASENLLGIVSATPFSPGLPTNVLTVGPTGAFATVQAAIDAAAPGDIVRVAPAGSPLGYPAFTVSSVPTGGLKIVADGTGQVNVQGPVIIENLGFVDTLELSDMSIGDQGSSAAGIQVQNCLGLVLIDEMNLEGGFLRRALEVTNSQNVVVQRSDLLASAGGLLVETNSDVFASRGTASDGVVVTGNSILTTVQLSTSAPTVDPGSTLTALPGVMPNLDLPDFQALGSPLDLTFQSSASSAWFLVSSGSFLPLGLPGIEGKVLINLVGFEILNQGLTNAAGLDEVSFFVSSNGALLGSSVVLQALSIDLLSGVQRVSNAGSVTLLPE